MTDYYHFSRAGQLTAKIIDITKPTIEPVTLDELKAHMRIDDDNDDAGLETYIAAARRAVERRTRCRLMNQTVELVRDVFPEYRRDLNLLLGNVRSVDSVKYRDADGDETTMSTDDYVAVVDVSPAVVRTKRRVWPTVSEDYPQSIRVRMTCGYTMTASVDRTIKIAVMMLAAHWYENREPVTFATAGKVLPIGIDSLLDSWPMTNYMAQGG